MRKIFLILIFFLAPLSGIALGMAQDMPHDLLTNKDAMLLSLDDLALQVAQYEKRLNELQNGIGFISETLAEQQRQYEQQQKLLQEMAKKSQQQKQLSEEIYEQQILAKLGTPFETFRSDQVEIKLFDFKEGNYRGYAAKVKLFDPRAIKVVLAKDTLGAKETTSEAVERTGAVFGVNGGGFYATFQQGEKITLPIGNTVIRGKLVNGFIPSHDDLTFSGWNKQGDLVGGIFTEKEELLKQRPWYGVTFVPQLLQDGQPLPIPEQWQRERHPRTIMGQYANGDLLFIVIDGRQPGWSRGVTLEGMQVKLLELGVIDAYNLDGGGSSTFVYMGKVLNRPSDGEERPVATNILVFP